MANDARHNMDTPPRPSWLTFSLRELLFLLAFFALALAALKYAGFAWELALSTIGIVLFMAATVMAVVDRGRRQAAAAGLAICLAIYGMLFWSSPNVTNTNSNRELDPNTGRLPTSKALQPLYEALVTRTTVQYPAGTFGGIGSGGGGTFGGGGFAVMQVETPDRGQFMAVGHWLWALLLGYAGLRVALWCYDRREKPRQAA